MKKLILLMVLLFSSSSSAMAAAAPTCKDRIKGFNIYEEMVDGVIVEKHSIFSIEEWSTHSAFEGVLVNSTEPSTVKVEVEIRKAKNGAPIKSGSWGVKSWENNKSYKVADGFIGQNFFQVEFENGGFFVMRLTDSGKTLCEEAPKKIYEED